MDNLLFCVNHPEKIAKRHCKKCEQDLCNDCVFDSHIEHHTEITKIEYSIDTKQTNFSQILSKEIKAIIDKSLNDLKPQLYQLVQAKTEEFLKDHKNLQLKLNKKEKKTNPPSSIPNQQEKKPNSNNGGGVYKKIDENNPIHQKNSKGNIKNRAKMFEN